MREIRASRGDVLFLRCGGAAVTTPELLFLLTAAMDLIGEALILFMDSDEGDTRNIF